MERKQWIVVCVPTYSSHIIEKSLIYALLGILMWFLDGKYCKYVNWFFYYKSCYEKAVIGKHYE